MSVLRHGALMMIFIFYVKHYCKVLSLSVAPQSTEADAGQRLGDCNGCHVLAVGNDYVWDTALQFSHF